MLSLLAACTSTVQTAIWELPTKTDSVHFVVIGDAGKDTPAALKVATSVKRHCQHTPCDFIVLTGDLLYPWGMNAPNDPQFSKRITQRFASIAPVILALGNHDYGYGRNTTRAQRVVKAAAAEPRVHLPAQTHAFTTENAAFVVLDTNYTFHFGDGGQQQFAADFFARADRTWNIVFAHHPLFSNGKHGNAGSYEGWSNVPYLSGSAVKTLLEGVSCGTAQLAFSGHEHSLQVIQSNKQCPTTWVVSGAGASSSPLIDRGNTAAFESSSTGFFSVTLSNQAFIGAYSEAGTLLWSNEGFEP